MRIETRRKLGLALIAVSAIAALAIHFFGGGLWTVLDAHRLDGGTPGTLGFVISIQFRWYVAVPLGGATALGTVWAFSRR